MRTLVTRILTALVLVSAGNCTYGQSLDSAWLQQKLDLLRDEADLVGLGATILVDGQNVAAAVSGKRRQNSAVLLTVGDEWHLGSITKSMTSTVIGRLVERGELSWDDCLPQLLPDMAVDFDPAWSAVSLNHLLTHSAGLPANFSLRTRLLRPDSRDQLHQGRRRELSTILSMPPISGPGDEFSYSNVGYTLAGIIAAEKAGTTWEDLMEKELFIPLELKSAGFGPPIAREPLDQPWGHQRLLFIRVAMDPKESADNTPIIGPAGIVHMSMSDLARYGWEHLRGETCDTALLKSQSFQKLHKSVIGDYAYGWIDWQRDWAGGRLLWHNGSNTYWYSLLMLVPSRNAVLVIVTNDGYLEKVEPAFFELAESIVKELPISK